MIQALNADPAGLRYMDTGGSTNRVTRIERPVRRKNFVRFRIGRPPKRGFLGGSPLKDVARPWGHVRPAGCPLSVSLVTFCTSRK